MCDCGNSQAGKYFAKIGGQAGDRLNTWGTGVVSGMQKRIKSWTGLGDYKINYNSLMGSGEPSSFSTHGRGLIIRHKEYLGDVVTGSAGVGQFNVSKFQINPANLLTFPWLNPIALQHDQYRPRGIIFEFVSTASETSTTASLGSVLFTTQYDVTDPDPISKAEMMNRAYSNEVKMSDNGAHGVECDPTELQRTLLYCRVIGSNIGDPRDFDMANFYIATQGGTLPINTIVGSLYVHYEFEFFKQNPFGGLPCKSQVWSTWSATNSAGAGTPINFVQLSPTLRQGRDLGITFAALSIIFPRNYAGATFLVTGYYQNTTTTATSATQLPILTNCTSSTNGLVSSSPLGYWMMSPRVASATNSCAFQILLNITPNINTVAVLAWGGGLANFPSVTVTGLTEMFLSVELISGDYSKLQ
ncbi:capsid protein [Crucivirus-380]|nr:capsid protein [Crucivirus-380]